MQNDTEFMEHLLTVIQANLENEDFTILQLAKATRYSRSQAFRRIKRLTDLSPSAFLLQQRLLRAKAMLLDPDCRLGIAQVAYAVGFRDAGYFGRAFKKAFGATAREVRETRKM